MVSLRDEKGDVFDQKWRNYFFAVQRPLPIQNINLVEVAREVGRVIVFAIDYCMEVIIFAIAYCMGVIFFVITYSRFNCAVIWVKVNSSQLQFRIVVCDQHVPINNGGSLYRFLSVVYVTHCLDFCVVNFFLVSKSIIL